MKYQIQLQDFLAYIVIDRGLSLNTKENYERDLRGYLLFIEKQNLNGIEMIERQHIQNYLIELYERGLNTKSVARQLSAIRTFHQYLIIEKISEKNPCDLIESPKLSRDLPEILSIDEVDRLLESFRQDKAGDIRNRAMVELLYASGLRVSEFLNLKLDDLNLSMKFIKCQGMGSKERLVPIGEVATEILELYLTNSRPELMKTT